ncbi:hypothetical protein [Haloterrigena alkaliphila]|uniref:DUF7978 domain-containing protein n=1 Tax=Haloterrigena alkaliphila TaxID=2816475 RepID=A0A8A2VK19_9EURY|nr:hypothetical protein [Haloterrigena alkaliphila]QSX00673.1 hypothetical protein J0X25_06865 [Haloterrigena alkaliphila]
MADDSQLEYDDERQVEEQPAQRPAAGQGTASELPIKEGAVFGAIAVIATYLAHLFLTAVSTAQSSPEAATIGEDLVVTEMVASWKAAGWSYLSAFGTGFEVDGEAATLGDAPNQAAAFAGGPFFLSELLLFLATVGGIVAAGYAVARYTDADDAADAAKAGATVAVPYLAFAALVALVMTHSFSEVPTVIELVEGEGSGVLGLSAGEFLNDAGDQVTSNVEFAPSTSDAILYAGLVVPVVLGALGGVLTKRREALETVMAKVQ